MEVDELPSVNPDVDFTQILPIQQKRTIAFINHFIMNTVSFLNTFCQSCESRLMEFEYKLQKVEASLLILESQLSSIPDLNNKEKSNETVEQNISKENVVEEINLPEVIPEEETKPTGVRACEDPRFSLFFKMLQVGVPPPAVKIKMVNEGFDSSILDNPNAIIPRDPTENLNSTDNP